jgi:hypothetical protein
MKRVEGIGPGREGSPASIEAFAVIDGISRGCCLCDTETQPTELDYFGSASTITTQYEA